MNTSMPSGRTSSAGQLPPNQATLVGLLIARWSLAEFSLLMPVIRATGVTQEVAAALLATTTSAGTKIDVTLSIVSASALPKNEKDDIIRSIKTLKKLVEQRNIVAHHLWAMSSDGETHTIDKRKLDNDPARMKRWSADDMKALINQTVQAAHEICRSSGSPWIDETAVKALML